MSLAPGSSPQQSSVEEITVRRHEHPSHEPRQPAEQHHEDDVHYRRAPEEDDARLENRRRHGERSVERENSEAERNADVPVANLRGIDDLRIAAPEVDERLSVERRVARNLSQKRGEVLLRQPFDSVGGRAHPAIVSSQATASESVAAQLRVASGTRG